MSAFNVISLEEAKVYLRIDDTQNETDNEISLMIRSAVSLVEKSTNVMLYDRDKTYNVIGNCVRIYDYPINSDTPTGFKEEVKPTYSIYTGDADAITLNVGSDDVQNEFPDLVDACKMQLKFLYYEQEKADLGVKMPVIVQEIIDTNKRFII